MNVYTCPMHPEIIKHKPGKCPKCGGMELILQTSPKNQYTPLIIIVSLITIVSLTTAFMYPPYPKDIFHNFMNNFMATYFIVFAGFKLLDLKGFVEGFSQYDLLAKRTSLYGYAYPFIELSLGFAYLTLFLPFITNMITFLFMLYSGIGVALKLRENKQFTCACLGTALQFPLTKVTLIENWGMAYMAFHMLF